MTPVATIVIPTRDRPDMAFRAIRSALQQTAESIEIIVVDDGSAEAFRCPTTDERVRVIRNRVSAGPCAARNVGLEAARAEWIAFLDDDDELLPHMVTSSLQAARESDLPSPVATLSGIADVDSSGRTVATRFPVTFPRGRHYFLENITQPTLRTENTLFAPTRVLRELGGWDAAIRSWEHQDLLLRLNAVCSLQGVPVVAYLWHEHDGPRRHDDMLDGAEGMARTLRKHAGLFALYPRRSAKYLGSMGVGYLKAGRWGSAISATTRAVIRDPRQPRLWRWWLACLTGPGGLALFRAGRRVMRSIRVGHKVPPPPEHPARTSSAERI